MPVKVTRIFFKSLGILLLFLLLVGMALFFAVQTYSFQTWLGKKASSYLSKELNTKIDINSIRIDFFTKANLEGVLILDTHKDTLLCGNLDLNVKRLDFRNEILTIENVTLSKTTAKLIKYKGDTAFNFNHFLTYFSGNSKDTSTSSNWAVNLMGITLDDISFVYRDEKFKTAIGPKINFDDIWLSHTSGKISRFKLKGDTIMATLSHFKTKEQSGFEIKDLSTVATISGQQLICEELRLQTPKTLIKGKIDFRTKSWNDYQDFTNQVYMDSELEDSTRICFTDIASFAEELIGLNETIELSGQVKGTVNEMNIKNVNFSYAKNTRFKGNISMSGITEFNSSYIHFDAKELSSNYLDIVQIPSYPFHEGKKLELPLELKRLGTLSYIGKFDGFVDDFTTYGRFNTSLGKVQSQLSIKLGKTIDEIRYNGKLKTENFDLGTLLGQSDFNGLSINSEIKGKGIRVNNLDAEFEGEITRIQYNGYIYTNIKLNGTFNEKIFNGFLVSKDMNADFDFNGTVDFTKTIPEMNFISTINRLNLKELHFTNKQDSGALSSQILINITGDDINNLSGQINFDNTLYKTTAKTYKLSSFNIQLEQHTEDKKIRLSSEYLNAAVFGKYQLINLKPAFENMLYNYFPSFFDKPLVEKKYTDELTAQIKIKKFNTINELFLPDIMVSTGTVLDANFNAKGNKLNMQLNSVKINYKSMFARDLVFILNENDSTVLAELSGKYLNLTDSIKLENFNVNVRSKNTKLKYSIDWDNLKKPSNKGELKGEVTYGENRFLLYNEKISATLNDSTWNLLAPNNIFIEKNRDLRIDSLTISNKQQNIHIQGSLSERPGDSLVISTYKLPLKQFNPLLQVIKFKLDGELNGTITVSNVNNKFAFNGDIEANNLVINDNVIGQALIKTLYYPSSRKIDIRGFTSMGIDDENGIPTKNISFKGDYSLDKKEESIDIDFSTKPANLKLLNPLLEGIMTINSGFVNGAGKVHGSPNAIKVDGKFRLFNSEVKVDYTNVVYNITGDIEVMPDQIRFSDLYMREKGSKSAAQGTINGNVFHDNFKNMQLDFDISHKNMLILNTTQKENSSFYGKVFGTGNIGIYGKINNLYMTIDNATNKNSRFYLPLDSPDEVSNDGFVQFIKKDTINMKKEPELSGFNLSILMHTTPDLNVQIIIDEKTGDILNVKGKGDIAMTVNTLGKFEMEGDYVISNGDYLFTIENVINKKFEIQPGSSISWSGDPLGAEIDVITSYKQRASVAPLLNDTLGTYKQPTAVDCQLGIAGKLFSPFINFKIEFPNIDGTARSRIENVLSDETELNRQVFSFLLFRTFVVPQIYNSNSGGVSAGGAAMSTGSELLSNRISDFLNTYLGGTGLKDIQLSVNYKPQTNNSDETMNVGLSKQFFDNRMTVDGNFGMTNSSSTTSNPNGLIGDLYVDYKLSPDGRFRIKGFNKSNDISQQSISGGPYTQGVGFFYRVEFETLKTLYEAYAAKVKKIEMYKNNKK
jgi:hypothetical protein